MWHLADYTVALGTTANTDVPALSDDVLTILNSHFVLRREMKLLRAAAMSATLTRVRFASPTMRFYGQPFVRPVILAANPPTNPNVADYTDRPFILPAGEEIAIEATSAIAMGTERFHALVWLQSQMQPWPPGNVYVIRGTSTTAAVANTWTTLTLTMDTALPSGAFALVHSEVIGTGAIAHRWIFDEQVDRPGFLSLTTETNRQYWEDYKSSQWGIMGRFINTAMPRLQVLADAATASWVIYLDVIPMSMAARISSPSSQVLLA